jgi:hypothetical protein
MAQTTIARPQSFTPAYNPVKYIIDSTNKNNTGFKYIFDVYNGATLIGRFKTLPTFGTGYGELDLSRFLSSYVSWDFDPNVTLDYDAANSYYQYQVKTGEEYLAEFTYTSALTNSGGFVRVNVTNTFAIGDQINIVQADGGTANPLVEGLHSVTNSSGSWFEIGVAWSSVTDANIDGVVTYADNRKVATYDVQTLASSNVFNGARRWSEFVYWNADEYNLNDPTKYWLTNQPLTNFNCTIAQDLWLNARARVGKKIVFENSNGDLFYKSVVANSTIQQIAVGPNNHGTLTPVVGVLPLVKDDTTYYEFWFDDAGQNSRKYRIDIDRRVQISEYDVVFLDRMGSYSSFAFQLKSYERGEVSREEYNKDVTGFVSGGQWSYNYEEFGYSTINLNAVKTLELNTNWMSQDMATYFEELVTSPQCFLKVVQYVTTEDGVPILDEDGCLVLIAESTMYVPVIVATNSYEVFNQRNKNLMKQTIVVKLANNDAING